MSYVSGVSESKSQRKQRIESEHDFISDLEKQKKNELIDFNRKYSYLFKGYSKHSGNKATLIKFMNQRLRRSNPIKKGIGDKLTAMDVDIKELDLGVKIEAEHSLVSKNKIDISYDHLKEKGFREKYSTYYSKMLIPAEKKWEKGKK